MKLYHLPILSSSRVYISRAHCDWQGNLEAILPRLSQFIANRRAAGLERPDLIQAWKSGTIDTQHFDCIANSDPGTGFKMSPLLFVLTVARYIMH